MHEPSLSPSSLFSPDSDMGLDARISRPEAAADGLSGCGCSPRPSPPSPGAPPLLSPSGSDEMLSTMSDKRSSELFWPGCDDSKPARYALYRSPRNPPLRGRRSAADRQTRRQRRRSDGRACRRRAPFERRSQAATTLAIKGGKSCLPVDCSCADGVGPLLPAPLP